MTVFISHIQGDLNTVIISNVLVLFSCKSSKERETSQSCTSASDNVTENIASERMGCDNMQFGHIPADQNLNTHPL
jgi:hypothetical protein